MRDHNYLLVGECKLQVSDADQNHCLSSYELDFYFACFLPYAQAWWDYLTGGIYVPPRLHSLGKRNPILSESCAWRARAVIALIASAVLHVQFVQLSFIWWSRYTRVSSSISTDVVLSHWRQQDIFRIYIVVWNGPTLYGFMHFGSFICQQGERTNHLRASNCNNQGWCCGYDPGQ